MDKSSKMLTVKLGALVIGVASLAVMSLKLLAPVNPVASRTVKMMYGFTAPKEIPKQVLKAREFLADDAITSLDFDNPLRTVNAYYKFGYEASRVNIVFEGDGVIIYNLINPNIPETTKWVFRYDVDPSGKLTNIHEYRMVGARTG